jgi:N-acetylmuramoyl-L-alanine amidase
MKKSYILFILIALVINGCTGLRLDPAAKNNFPNLRFSIQKTQKGVFWQNLPEEKVGFKVNSKLLTWDNVPIALNTSPQIRDVQEKFFCFNLQKSYLFFDSFALVDILLNQEKYRKKIEVVVLDAGHGGKDPGAVGAKFKEKDLNLNLVLALKSYLEEQGKRVYLTRACDEYYTLAERVEFLKSLPEKVDLFISIHQNASTNNQANGIETYFPTKILTISDMSESEKFNFLIACNIQQKLAKNLNLKNRGVKFANFYVLKHNSVPAILIECGFISNPDEETILASKEYISKFIESISQAL